MTALAIWIALNAAIALWLAAVCYWPALVLTLAAPRMRRRG